MLAAMKADQETESGPAALASTAAAEVPDRSLAWRAFALTWISYASYYLTRKNFSVAKRSIELDLGVNRASLGLIDTGYLAAYSVGQFASGFFADKAGARLVLSVGMIATAACSVLFGLSSTFALFALFFGLNGLAQSTGWSPNLKVMTAWFPRKTRGSVMGFWSTCYQFGSLVANPIAGLLLAASVLGWRLAFFAPAVWVAGVGLALFLWLPEKRIPVDPAQKAAFDAEVRTERGRVLRTPLVWALGASYFFMKLIRYILLFWLPYYMEETLHYPKGLAAVIPLAFEAGGLLGSITIGALSDRWFGGRRLGVALTSLVMLAGAMPLYGFAAQQGVAANAAALALVGFFLFGPDTLLSATAAQDLGGPAAAATAGGVINGVGSLGPIIGSALAASISLKYGWSTLYALLGGCAVLSACVIVPFQRREIAPPRSA
jgi:sugar phosphate permease